MRRPPVWLAFAGLLAGCGQESGIIVQVSGPQTEELAFEVAVRGDHDQFVLDPSVSGERRPVPGRDLRANPYELLLRQEWEAADTPASTVRVLALGYRSGAVASFALLEPPQAFLRGELLRRALLLQELPGAGSAGPAGLGCYSVQAGGKTYLLVAEGDRDCDGFAPPQDCNDLDAAVHPGAPEICDGKDDNCDGTYELSEDCYGKDSTGSCRVGSRTCSEGPSGGGTLGPCTVADDGAPATEQQCLVYAGCTAETAPLPCLAGRMPTFSCKMEVTATGVCGGARDLPYFFSGNGCTWKLMEAGGWSGASVQQTTCSGKLAIAPKSALGAGSITVQYTQGTRTAFVTYEIGTTTVTACSSHPLTCTLKK